MKVVLPTERNMTNIARPLAECKTEYTIIPNDFYDYGIYLTHRAVRVYCYLARKRNSNTNLIFPSYTTIMNKCGIIKRNDLSDTLYLN